VSTLDKEDLPDWQRHFAATANNRAWELSTQKRSAEENEEMLNAAHASAFHWSSIGTELNQMRATMLLAEVHAILGFGPSAYAFAQEMKAFFTANETPDWELAFTYAIHAHASHANGNLREHTESYIAAERAIIDIESEEDRAIVVQTFNLVPKP
jgi:hypothetical protein